jgi:hypothetical protein
MHYTFTGRLCGYICPDTEEPLANMTVLLYRPEWDQQDVVRAVAAETKETFRIVDGDEVDEKEDRLLAEVETDDEGEFEVDLGAEREYEGEAIEVDVRTDHVPGEFEEDTEPVQFTVTTLQPRWRQAEEGGIARWEHCIARRFWCEIRRLFGAWVICGRVTYEETGDPVARALVSAFDVDIIEDDPLGTTTASGDGAYRIYYKTSDFERTPAPFGPIELEHGPDVRFLVRDVIGSPIIDEPRSRGRQPDRENVGPCERIDLEVTDGRPPGPEPLFTHVGPFHIRDHIDSQGRTLFARGPPDHRVGGDGYGFFRKVTLEGFCPETDPVSGERQYYRFLFRGAGSTDWTPVTGAHIVDQLVGGRLDAFSGFEWQDIYVAPATVETDPSDPAPDPETVIPTAGSPDDDLNGWIEVVNTYDDGYEGPLLRLDTSKLVPGGSSGAGTPGDPPTDPKSGGAVEIAFETTVEASDGGPDPAKADRQGLVATVFVNNFPEVRQLRVEELHTGAAGGCTEITDQVTVNYTVDHELLASWGLTFTSDAPHTGGFPPSPLGGTTPRGQNDTVVFTVTDATVTPPIEWPECSYDVRLSSRRKLTDGVVNDDGDVTRDTFCISRPDGSS